MATPQDPKSPVMAYAVSALISSFVFYAIYLVLLHPLHEYPGPFLAKLTDWYAGSHVFRKDIHLTTHETHVKYGSVVRLAPNRLVFNTVTAFRDIYKNDRVSKSYTYRPRWARIPPNTFTALNKTVHRGKRRIISAALSERATKSLEPLVMKQLDIYLEGLLKASQASEPTNFTNRARWLALDIIGNISFGYQLETQTSEENHFVANAIDFGLYRSNILHHLYYLSIFSLHKITDTVIFQYQEKYWHLLEKMIEARVARGKDGDRDFYSFISELGAEEGGIRRGELFSEATIIMVAGSDTTATALSATFFYLARNPECYEKLCSEIRSTFTSGQDIRTGPQLASCRYLRACLDEGMRMSPPVPGTLWRVQDPDDEQPLVIDGHVIPKGTLMGVSTYAIHHNEEYFPDSFAFRPERWLATGTSPDEQAAAKRMHDAFAVFSTGSRSCAGKSLAYMQSTLVLAKTLWYFDFESAPGKLGEVGGGRLGGPSGRRRPDEYQLEDIFAASHDGPYLKFRTRGEQWRDPEGAT
ncbi:cytochrome P450 [Xylaria cf. heliscus]|nr:cytochrome P450 [Xylaria cf. heliscus]